MGVSIIVSLCFGGVFVVVFVLLICDVSDVYDALCNCFSSCDCCVCVEMGMGMERSCVCCCVVVGGGDEGGNVGGEDIPFLYGSVLWESEQVESREGAGYILLSN